ncbi:MAG: beta-galactosidase [Eubacteriales bacterium]
MIQTPFLGCAYYPEDWAESQIPYDIQKMKEAGITCARIGEFAWRKMEPVRGEYDFAWLHRVVDALGEAGIAVVMGTPTATPPIWLSREYPDVFSLNDNGTRSSHGGRRHCCSSNPHYLEACDAIVHALGREFGRDRNVIGWQLDNEIYTWGTGCVCEYCTAKYHRDLEKKYGNIAELNRQWNLNLFSQAYDRFDEIPAGDGHAWHNPHLRYEWCASHYDADISFIHRQAEILRQYTDAPIGTDMMPLNGMDYEKMNETLDVVMFNHYNEPSNLTDEIFWFDFLRTLRDRPFWNTETATTWNGSVSISQHLKPEGYCRLNSWLPVALGGESNMYWLWRQHWAGHELVHGSVLTPEGRPVHVFGEIQQTAREFEQASDFISSTKVDASVAIHYTSKSWQLFQQQPIVDHNDYSAEVRAVHRSLRSLGVCPDVIGARASLDKYKVLFSPLQMTLEDDGMAEKIEAWVRDGGVWVAGPMTDIRNSIGAHYTDRAMGMLEKLLGIRQDYNLPTDGSLLKAAWSDGEELICRRWAECYTNLKGGDVLAAVTSGHSALNGEVVIGRYSYGKGEIILCGVLTDEAGRKRLLKTALSDAAIRPFEVTGNLCVIPRKGPSAAGLILCETACAPASIVLPSPMVDLLTGEEHEGTMVVQPYGVHVLVEK